ncbi:MAG: polysaccharide pyruvyl transferase family protein [Butyrivibrio sp.]|nr:polysaccharide pyruvyl transferase family protein [Butyrivibrio sp.]
MNIGIITHYAVHNHGASLQLNALIKVLKRNFNKEAKALQFETNYDFADKSVRDKHHISIRSVGYFLNYIRERGLKLFLFNIRKKRLFDGFNAKEQLIGPWSNQCENLDAVIIGSDEVFSLFAGPTPEFFGYNLPSKKVFSYAGCFGPTTIDDVKRVHCEDFVRNGLNSMVGLSMRDQNSIEVAKEFTGRDAELVVDPVILYGYQEELEKLTDPGLPKYLLVYAYESRLNDPKEYQAILDYAHKEGMIVVCPGFYHKWADKNTNTDPVELLRYFKYAECVVTDTFHGCVMSLIAGADMAVAIRDNGNKLLNLLKEYHIEDRRIDKEWNIEKIFSKKVDWSVTNAEIERRREQSMRYLTKMLEK